LALRTRQQRLGASVSPTFCSSRQAEERTWQGVISSPSSWCSCGIPCSCWVLWRSCNGASGALSLAPGSPRRKCFSRRTRYSTISVCAQKYFLSPSQKVFFFQSVVPVKAWSSRLATKDLQ
jgi:hypothetical protein